MSATRSYPLLISSLKSIPAKSVVLDCTWHMPTSPRVAANEFLESRIQGARFIDLDKICPPAPPLNLPHMLPTEDVFAKLMNDLGILPDSRIILYDTIGIFTSPRVAWMLSCFGNENWSVLDGGLASYSGPLESGPVSAVTPVGDYGLCKLDTSLVVDYEEMSQIVEKQSAKIYDARSHARFSGANLEPRAGISSGHMPAAICLPYSSVLSGKKFKSQEELKQLLPSGDKVMTCGSGISACILWLASRIARTDDSGKTRVYDESWTGWASRPESRIDKDV